MLKFRFSRRGLRSVRNEWQWGPSRQGVRECQYGSRYSTVQYSNRCSVPCLYDTVPIDGCVPCVPVPPRVARLAAGRAAPTHPRTGTMSIASSQSRLTCLACLPTNLLPCHHPLAVRSPGFNGAGAEGPERATKPGEAPDPHIQYPSHRTPAAASPSTRPCLAQQMLFVIKGERPLFNFPGFPPVCGLRACVRVCVLVR